MLNVSTTVINDVASAPVIKRRAKAAKPKADSFKTILPNPFLAAETAKPRPRPTAIGGKLPDCRSLVSIIDGRALASSLDVAAYFAKEHRNVLRDIDGLRQEVGSDLSGPIFQEGSYADGQGKTNRCFYMNRDAFTLLAMGFQGTKALSFKIAYIAEFNRMEATLRQPHATQHDGKDPLALRQSLRLALDGWDADVQRLTAEADRERAEKAQAQAQVKEQAVVIQQREAEASALGAKVERLASKADAFDLLSAKTGESGLMETSRELTGRPMALIELLKVWKIIFRESETSAWQPYARYGESGAAYFAVRERPDRYRENVSHPQCMVTAKGRAWIAELLGQTGLPLPASRKGKWRPPLKA
jgi:Rha family phage regulatory protein